MFLCRVFNLICLVVMCLAVVLIFVNTTLLFYLNMNIKRRKVKTENRQFLSEWTDLYCFILPSWPGALSVCLICHQTVAVMKVFDVKRHYETSHESFAEKSPTVSHLRRLKIENVHTTYK